ncbi:MAG TPA: hypothetical protein VJ813_18680 [Vicinamibacterales bacterium]|nr:hypothetical protein [Vicinamibacterales bacterium]
MCRIPVALSLFLVTPAAAFAAEAVCDARAVRDQAETARFNIIAAVDGAEAIDAWRHVMANGGAIGWSATEYNVDARSTWVFAFDRAALRVYRSGAFAAPDDALRGCLDPAVRPEAVIPWENVREIEAGNWVTWFRLRQPVDLRSDRGKHESVKELKVFFHGAQGDTLTYRYDLKPAGRHWFWDTTVYRVENLRGIAVGPTDFQRRFQFVLANAVDPQGRIALKRQGRGAGW